MPKVLRLILPTEQPHMEPNWLAAVIEDLGARFNRRDADTIIQEPDGSVLLTVHEVENIGQIKSFLGGLNISYQEANEPAIVSLESALGDAPKILQDYVERLQAALEMTATSLGDILAGHPVANASHCFSAAESLLHGTKYMFKRF
jgi:CTP:molybdopterin cytidylyltransferase MocA